MTALVKLTTYDTGDGIWVNADLIRTVKRDRFADGTATAIEMPESSVYVRESAEDVVEMVGMAIRRLPTGDCALG